MTYTFPYDFGQAIFIPNRFMGKVMDVDEYEVAGYRVDKRGVFVELFPVSDQSVPIRRRVNDPQLYTTEAEAREDKRIFHKGALNEPSMP